MNKTFPLEITVEEAAALLGAGPGGVMLIDVREPDETAIACVPGATRIPMRQIPGALPSLPRDKHLLIQCHHGGRSLRVTEYLRASGFENASNIAGGIDAWALRIDPSLARY